MLLVFNNAAIKCAKTCWVTGTALTIFQSIRQQRIPAHKGGQAKLLWFSLDIQIIRYAFKRTTASIIALRPKQRRKKKAGNQFGGLASAK